MPPDSIESSSKRKAAAVPPTTTSTLEEPRPTKTPKQDPTQAATVSPAEPKSPFELRLDAFSRFKGEEDMIMFFGDPLSRLSASRLEELGFDEEDDMQDRSTWHTQLTAQEVDTLVSAMLLPVAVHQTFTSLCDKLLSVDGPPVTINGDLSMGILDTSTTYRMYTIIDKMLSGAQRLLNKAMKTCSTTASTTLMPNVAKEAFGTAFSAIWALHEVDHWRIDTEDPEQTDKFAKRVIKMIKDLLWFEDKELGFSDPYSRQGMINFFGDMYKDWLGSETKMNYIVASNGHGHGRLHAKPKAPPAPKSVVSAASAVTNASTASTATAPLVAAPNDTTAIQAYLNALGNGLDDRTKTILQLRVVDTQTNNKKKKTASVVLSGATHLKKLNEVIAFITGASSEVSYHPQKGKCLKDSRLEVTLNPNTMWFTDKTSMKKVPLGQALFDKDIKVVQIFQGIAKNNSSGIVYDSELAKTISLFWVSPEGKRFQIEAEAIVPLRICGKPNPMPRLVHQEYENSKVRNGFGVSLRKANGVLLGGRDLPTFWSFGSMTKSEMKKWGMTSLCRPLCDDQGKTDLFGFK